MVTSAIRPLNFIGAFLIKFKNKNFMQNYRLVTLRRSDKLYEGDNWMCVCLIDSSVRLCTKIHTGEETKG